MFYQLAIIAALAAYSAAFRGVDLDFMTTADMERYFSVSTAEEVPEYDIVSPTAYSAGGRHRRSIEFEETSKEIKFAAFGENFHVSLEENTELLPSGLQVDRHNADGSIDQVPLKSRHCFYHGNLISHEISKVAVSTCDGMSGMLAVDKYDMFIQPLTEEHADKYKRARRDVENPHIIYRRSTDKPVENSDEHFCALDPEYPISAMLYESMDMMHKMHASLASGPVEVEVVDFGKLYEAEYTDETTTLDDDYYLDTTTESPWPESTTGVFDDVESTTESVESTTESVDSEGSPGRGQGGDKGRGDGDRGRGDDERRRDPSSDDESSRRKRQTLGTRYLEVRVLADADMTRYHGESSVVAYAVTLMNIVAARYIEPSLGRRIVIHIVKLGYATSDTIQERGPNGVQAQLNVVKDGPSTLNSWSVFQQRTNPTSDNDAGHWDNAVLISRKNLEINRSPNLLGIAWGNATCFLPRQANLNQDQGLSSGLVIAHEIGHTLGMNHDSDNGCVNGINVMSSHRPNGPGSFQWSRCSVVDLNRFLSDRFKTCLNDQPTGISQWPLDSSQRPGATISADQQCVLQSTDTTIFVRSCTQTLSGICANLFCQNNAGSCWSSVAAAEGTPCGNGRSCVSGQCVVDNTQPPTATYAWRAGTFGSCSVTCGTGVQTRSVTCYSSSTNSPVSANLCSTQPQPTNSQTCTLQTCPISTTYAWRAGTFGSCSVTCGTGIQTRSVTCYSSSTNSPVSNNLCSTQQQPTNTQTCTSQASCPFPTTYAWRTGTLGPCSVTCGTGIQTRSVTCYSSTNSPVSDNFCSTQQRPTNTQTCTLQTCPVQPAPYWQPLGYGSCNDATCQQTRLVLCVSTNGNNLQQVDISQCNIAIKPQTTQSCLNSNNCKPVWVASDFSQCSASCGGGTRTRTVICRPSTSSSETLSDFQCAQSGAKPNTFESCNTQTCGSAYSWFVSNNYGACSVTCGTGIQSTVVLCTDAQGRLVADSFCPQPKPQGNTRQCNAAACGRWSPLQFSQCSVTCGPGIQQRQVVCRSTTSSNTQLPESSCDPNTKPSAQQACNLGTCPTTPIGRWVTTELSQCSTTCGPGTQSRQVFCASTTSQLPESSCDPSTKPSTTQTCNLRTCPSIPSGRWVPTQYSPCSATCGVGIQQRQVVCRSTSNSQLPDSSCDPNTKPPAQQQCYLRVCPTAPTGQWRAQTQFSQCSVTCGAGTQSRTVICRSTTTNTQLPDSSCDPNTKPSTQQACFLRTCPSNPSPGSNTPDQGVACAGVYTRPVNNLRIFGNGQSNCRYVIVAPPGQDIKLTFSECNIRCNQGDYRGVLRDATNDDVPFCCTGAIDANTGTNFVWTSETHILQLEVNDRSASQGFAVKVEFVGAARVGCDTVLTAPSGTVTSPNYPNNYPGTLPPNGERQCQHVIVAPPGKKVQLTFNDLSFAQTRPFAPCSQSEDRVEVYNIDDLQRGVRYCGSSNSPNSLQKPNIDNRALVQFISNGDNQVNRGFSITYNFV